MNRISMAAARDVNDVLQRLGWYGWYAFGTERACVVTLQYRREDGTTRAVDCDVLNLMKFIKAHPRRCEVAKVCDRKPASMERATQQELDFSGQSALVRDALNPNKQ